MVTIRDTEDGLPFRSIRELMNAPFPVQGAEEAVPQLQENLLSFTPQETRLPPTEKAGIEANIATLNKSTSDLLEKIGDRKRFKHDPHKDSISTRHIKLGSLESIRTAIIGNRRMLERARRDEGLKSGLSTGRKKDIGALMERDVALVQLFKQATQLEDLKTRRARIILEDPELRKEALGEKQAPKDESRAAELQKKLTEILGDPERFGTEEERKVRKDLEAVLTRLQAGRATRRSSEEMLAKRAGRPAFFKKLERAGLDGPDEHGSSDSSKQTQAKGKQQATSLFQGLQQFLPSVQGDPADIQVAKLKAFMNDWVKQNLKIDPDTEEDEKEGIFRGALNDVLDAVGMDFDRHKTVQSQLQAVNERIREVKNKGFLERFYEILAILLGGQRTNLALQIIKADRDSQLDLLNKKLSLLENQRKATADERRFRANILMKLISQQAKTDRGGISTTEKQEKEVIQLNEALRKQSLSLNDTKVRSEINRFGDKAPVITSFMETALPAARRLIKLQRPEWTPEQTEKAAHNTLVMTYVAPVIASVRGMTVRDLLPRILKK